MTRSDLPPADARGRIVVTGASGFIGGAVARRLVEEGRVVVTPVRDIRAALPEGVLRVAGPALGSKSEWPIAGADAIIHCAARVHLLRDRDSDPLAAFRQDNVEGTLQLARQAAAAGVRRFVFISSIGVNGAETAGRPFTSDDLPAPHSPYAQSKLEAEVGLRELGEREGMQVVIIRPPLVYGRGAPGNFRLLVRAIRSGIPLPVGSIQNRRSFVAIGNLGDLVTAAVEHQAAAGQTLLVSDGEDLSTPDLVSRLAASMGKPARIFRVPVKLLESTAAAVGRPEVARQLCRSLQVDISKTERLLGWSPPIRVDDALRSSY